MAGPSPLTHLYQQAETKDYLGPMFARDRPAEVAGGGDERSFDRTSADAGDGLREHLIEFVLSHKQRSPPHRTQP